MTSPRFLLPILCLLAILFPGEPDPRVKRADPTSIAIAIVVSLALSYAAGQLMKKKGPIQDEKPSQSATRGTPIPRLIGERRIGSVVGWVGNRLTRKETVDGKGGVFDQRQRVYVEDGWHLLCVGPGRGLKQIEQSGKVIFEGPITPSTHPSGSTIDVGNEGSFEIYWGETNQPVISFLGLSTNVPFFGISSRWPGTMSILWRRKRLGTSPTWPLITYVVDVGLQATYLNDSEAYFGNVYTTVDPDPFWDDVLVVGRLNGAPGVGYVETSTWKALNWQPGRRVRLIGNVGVGSDIDLTVRSHVIISGSASRGASRVVRTFFEETLTGLDVSGRIEPYLAANNDGWNPAHIAAELLFAPWPYGLGQDGATYYDIESLEAFGVLAEAEGLRCSVLAKDGEELRVTLGSLLKDCGVMLSMNRRTGLLEFVPVREPSGTPPTITYDMQPGQPPEFKIKHGRQGTAERAMFVFQDREYNFRDNLVSIDDDGRASQGGRQGARSIEITSTTNYATASIIAERRSQEDLAASRGVLNVEANRAARVLIPGTYVNVDGVADTLMVHEVEPVPNSGLVKVAALINSYGIQASEFENRQGGGQSGQNQTDPDFYYDPIEMPEALTNGTQPQTVIVVRIRGGAGVASADIWISRDNVTYTLIGPDLSIMTGGVLLDAVPIDGEEEPTTGPTFTLLGPDANSTLDLTADVPSWRGGRQLAILARLDSTGSEICYLRKITNVSGTTYRLDGLIRSRYDTRPRVAFAPGDIVYVLQNEDGLPIQDVLLAPQVTLYAKSQARGDGVLPLSTLPPAPVALYGKAVRPVSPSGVRLDLGSGSAGSGTAGWTDTSYVVTGASPADDLVVRWAWSTPRTALSGAGAYGFGSLVEDTPPEGTFLVEILDSLNVVKRSATVGSASYTYLRADRLADFGGEPVLFKVRVTQQRGGYSSDSVTTTITKV